MACYVVLSRSRGVTLRLTIDNAGIFNANISRNTLAAVGFGHFFAAARFYVFAFVSLNPVVRCR